MNVMPVLKPENWEGLKQGALAHVWVGTPAEPIVVVAYTASDGPEMVADQGLDPDERELIVRRAFGNLESYRADFELVEAPYGRVLVSAGQEFAAEKVLCQSHMLRAHDQLGAAEIVVSLPRRGSALVTSYDCSQEVKQAVVALHRDSWDGGGPDSERIVNELIVMHSGRKVRSIPIPPAGSAAIPLWV